MAGPFDPYGEDPSCKKTDVLFGIYGEELNPDELTERTGLKPSSARVKGQRIPVSKHSRGGPYFAQQGRWQICSEPTVASSSTEIHAQYILELLEPHAHIIDQFLNKPGYSTVISLSWTTDECCGGFSLRPTTLARLCRLCDRIDTHFFGRVYPQEERE